MTLDFSLATSSEKVVAILRQHGVGNWRARGGTDKEQLASDEEGSGHHSYGVVYEEIARRLNANHKNVNVVEIGVQYGGSLLLWEGLFPKGAVIGLDIEDKMHDYVKQSLDWKRAEVWQKNAYEQETIDALADKFPDGIHMMVDDGPHTVNTQAAFICHYVPLLADGGYAVVEDIQGESQMQELSSLVLQGMEWEVIDRRSVNGRYDDLMLVIHKPTCHDEQTKAGKDAESDEGVQGGHPQEQQRRAGKKPSAGNRNRTKRSGSVAKEKE